MRPTCLQRCRRPASEHDFLRTKTKQIIFLVIKLSVNSVNLIFFASHFTFRCDIVSYRSRQIMNPGFRNNFPGFWDIHSDQMINPNEAQDRYMSGQLYSAEHLFRSGGSFGALSASSTPSTGTSRLL